jgi:shikimate kinase
LDMNSRNIVITGFMGTGKSTVAPVVAEQLGRTFIETDAEIIQRAGKTIPEIFADQGEPAFRQMEHDLCVHLAEQRELVIATGGGMLINEANRQLMLDSALVICLSAPPDVIEQRLSGDDGRPLAGKWRELLQARQAAYAAIPSQIDTTGKAPEQIAQEVIALWQNQST